MTIAVAIALSILALVFVLFPVYQHWHLQRAFDSDVNTLEVASTETNELLEREQIARQALQEVEFDYQLGNMNESDYLDLRERYMQRAVTALKARHEQEQEIDDEIEEQLRQMKEGYADEKKHDTNA